MRARALAFGVVIVLLAGACTDDSDSVPKVEKDDLVRDADAICKAADTELAGLLTGTSSQTKAQLTELLNTKVLPRLDKELGDLKDLGEPKTSRRDWDDIVKAFDTALSSLKQEADVDPAKAITDAGPLFNDANAKAVAFGLKECGKS